MATPAPTSSPLPSSETNENFVATSIFIDQVSEYDRLPYCAEQEISTIVRDMANGYGDGSRMTSYTCFCYDSSTFFSSLIGAHVETACDDGAEPATAAVEVFSEYCQLGLTRELGAPTVVSASTTSAAAAPSTPSSTSATSSLNSSATSVRTLAAAVGVPVLVIALITGAFLYRRARKRRSQGIDGKGGSGHTDLAWDDKRGYSIPSTRNREHPVELVAQEREFYNVVELPVQKNRYSVVKLNSQRTRFSAGVVELPTHDG